MNNKDYVDAVNSGKFPSDIAVPLDKPFTDSRGIIQNLWLGSSGSITYIESVKGAVRARHKHHNNDYHSTFIISGKVKYTELEDDEKTVKLEREFSVGDMFFTGPEVFHIMEFLEDSKMITVNGIVKNHENYEKSIERMK